MIRVLVIRRIRGERLESDAADDITQDVLANLIRSGRPLPEGRDSRIAILGWYARNAAVEYVLKARRRKRNARELKMEPAPGHQETADLVMERKERSAALARAVEELPVHLRVYVDATLQGRTHAEVAREHGIPDGTAATRSGAARAHLRTALRRFGR